MAQILGISLNGYRKIEGGKTALINPRLNDISRVLNIPAENLLFENLSQSFLDQIAEKDSRIESLQKLLSESEMQRELLKAEIDCANSEYKASIESKNTLIGILKDKISKY
jgi:transcriptional regulator with XRE-family HTH domain